MSNNYFTSATGKVVTQWPYGNMLYRVLTKLLGRVSETTPARRRADHTRRRTRGDMTHPFSYQGPPRRRHGRVAWSRRGAARAAGRARRRARHRDRPQPAERAAPRVLRHGPLRRGRRARRRRADRRPGERPVQQRGRGRHATARRPCSRSTTSRCARCRRACSTACPRAARSSTPRRPPAACGASGRRRSTRCSTSTSPTAGPRRCNGSTTNLPTLGQTPYNFSKEVVEVHTMRSSRPTMRRGVRTNAVCPGPIDTPLLPEFRQTTSDKIVDWNIREMGGARGQPARGRDDARVPRLAGGVVRERRQPRHRRRLQRGDGNRSARPQRTSLTRPCQASSGTTTSGSGWR